VTSNQRPGNHPEIAGSTLPFSVRLESPERLRKPRAPSPSTPHRSRVITSPRPRGHCPPRGRNQHLVPCRPSPSASGRALASWPQSQCAQTICPESAPCILSRGSKAKGVSGSNAQIAHANSNQQCASSRVTSGVEYRSAMRKRIRTCACWRSLWSRSACSILHAAGPPCTFRTGVDRLPNSHPKLSLDRIAFR
jgi:hypothetical protein